jgi:endonuclease/exonuclease/phosphatase family metal-dependent hydrolase
MNTLAWNCRGVGGSRKHQFIASLLRSTRSNVAFVAETKRSLRRSKNILQHFPLPNYEIVPSRGRSGGLWLLWDDNTNLTVITKTRFLIHAEVVEKDSRIWDLVCVYGDSTHALNCEIWQQITNIAQEGRPLCVMGDFNAITSTDEKVGGDPRLNVNSHNFKRFLCDAQLLDLGFKGWPM